MRFRFRVENKMVESIKGNFKSDYKRKNISISCSSCKKEGKVDTQSHVFRECEAFSDLREDLDPENDDHILKFFRKVIERRIKEVDNHEN